MLKEKIHSRIMDIGIKAFSLIGYNTSRSREYEFAFQNIPYNRCKILDVGSSGSLFPLKMAVMGYKVYIIDVREYHEKHPNISYIQTDIKNMPYPNKSFDAITCISTIEHIGLSAYGDPNYESGDKLALEKMRDVLKADGRLILTTPFSGSAKLMTWKNSIERIYDYDTLMNLFGEFNVLKEEFYIPLNSKNWVKATRNEAEREHSANKRSNLCCFVLS